MAQQRPEKPGDLVLPSVAEFVGSFTLVMAGAGAIIATGGGDLVAIALAHGLAIGLMVAAVGHICGGHFNPAVSLAMLLTRQVTAMRFGWYVVFQLGGGVVAALLLKAVFPPDMRDAVTLGVPAVSDALTAGQGFAIEVVATFFLVMVIFGTAVDGRGPRSIAALAIGLAITMDIFWAGGATGAAMNPQRAFGPALVEMAWADHWVYWLGPGIGAAIAGILHWFILQEGKRQPAA